MAKDSTPPPDLATVTSTEGLSEVLAVYLAMLQATVADLQARVTALERGEIGYVP